MQGNGEEQLERVRKELNNLYRPDKEFLADSDFIFLYTQLLKTGGIDFMPKFVRKDLEPVHYKLSDKKIIAFSGGRISLACALRYKDIGADIILLHLTENVKNVGHVSKVAEMLSVPLVVRQVEGWEKLKSTQLSSAVIMNEALGHMSEEGYVAKLVYGYFEQASIYNNQIKDRGKCKEYINVYKSYIKRIIPDFDILSVLPNYSIVWDEILRHKPYLNYLEVEDAIDAYVLKNTKMDFNVDECVSSIYMRNISKLNKEYIARHKKSPDNINQLWNEFFFHRIENSKCYKQMMRLPL